MVMLGEVLVTFPKRKKKLATSKHTLVNVSEYIGTGAPRAFFYISKHMCYPDVKATCCLSSVRNFAM